MEWLQAVLTALLILLSALYGLILAFVIIHGRRTLIKRDPNAAVSFTVFLPTYNEGTSIVRKLDNLLSQTAFKKYDGEILVIDCSTDQTRKLVREYACKDARIKLIEQPERTGNARTFNEAINQARGEILVKTDCDSTAASSEELARLIQVFPADDHVGGVTGICLNIGREGAFRSLLTKLQIAESNVDSTIVAHSPSYVGFRRSALTFVDPESMAEDTEEFVRIRKMGLRTLVDDDVRSVELVPTRFHDRIAQKQRRAQGIIRVLLQNMKIMFNPSYGSYGSVVFPINFFLLVVSPILLLICLISTLWLSFVAGYLGAVLAGLLAVLVSYLIGRPSWLAALLDIQIFALIGTLNILVGRHTATWKIYRI